MKMTDSIYSDADIEMAGMEDRARGLAAARRAGQCVHDGLMNFTCRGCGRVFESDEEWVAATDELAS